MPSTRSHRFIHPRVVLHGAGAQRIHAEIDGVVPGGKAGEVADDFDLAHFRHVAQIFSFGCTEKFGGIHFGHVERRKLPRGFSGRGFFEDQAFVLIDLAGGFRVWFRASSRHLFHGFFFRCVLLSLRFARELQPASRVDRSCGSSVRCSTTAPHCRVRDKTSSAEGRRQSCVPAMRLFMACGSSLV